ncbi:MAG: DUF4832 domain-containing protein [Fibrobacter sp.]|nr:DUF4832 domain-containing protein [Fibrobacter sp.]
MKKEILLFTLLFLSICSLAGAASMVNQNLDYSDKLLDLKKNPARGPAPHKGFYLYPGKELDLKTNGTVYNDFMRFLVDLGGFSDNAYDSRGKSDSLDDVSLNNIRAALDSVRRRGGACTIRASYDIDCIGHQDPDYETILSHTKQLAKLYSDYEDVIHYVEFGMFGTCGEQNNANLSFEQMANLLQAFLENSSSGIRVGMRSPIAIAKWLGLMDSTDKYQYGSYPDFDINSPRFQDTAQARAQYMSRVGLYNDGYLGSDGDLGTFGAGSAYDPLSREKVVSWLEKYGVSVPYGGDFVFNHNESPRPPLNTAEFMSYEGFRTHTSYVGASMEGEKYNNMDTELFKGPDPEYGMIATGKKYITDHLGYRFVVRDSKIIDSVGIGGKLKMDVKLQNVGFGNNLMVKKSSLVLKHVSGEDTAVVELPLNIDPTKIYSKKLKMKTDNPIPLWNGHNFSDLMEDVPEFDGVNLLKASVTLPDDLPQGEWSVYLRFSHYADYKTDKNFHVIQFANDSSYYDSVTGSNYIGKFILSDKVVDPEEPEEPGEDYIKGFVHDINLRLTVSNRSIQIMGLNPNTSVALMDMQGRTLQRMQSLKTSCEINVSRPGKYFVRVGNDVRLVTIR